MSEAVAIPVTPSNRREQTGWYFYEWATAGFTTTVTAVLIGPYLTDVTKAAADANDFVHPLGIAIRSGSFFPYMITVSVLLQLLFMPLLGAIADYVHFKKQMLAVSAYIGALLTMGMYFLQGNNYLLGSLLFVLATLFYSASVIFCNAFLPQIAQPNERDTVSSRSWALGTLGAGILLALNLGLLTQDASLGLNDEMAVRIDLASAGVWWAIFTVIPLTSLRRRQTTHFLKPGQSYLAVGFSQLSHTLSQVRGYPQTLLFLVGYLLYNDGIQTVIGLWSEFGQEEIGLDLSTLTEVVLLVQFVGIFGALGFNYVAQKVGTKRALVSTLVVWTLTLIYVYAYMRTTLQVFAVATVIALALGGSQALSRSAYSLMIPQDKEAEYFSLYQISASGTSWLGPLLFGLALQFTGSYRIAIVSLVVFFLAGLILLARVDLRRAAVEAGNEATARA